MDLIPAFLLAKCVRLAARLRGGGSAFPGLVLLKMVPDVLSRKLSNLPLGVIFVTGSNGKSTTTSMLASLLRAHGLAVFTNPAGGNLPQGLASALVGQATLWGRLRADIAVLEVDEAYGHQIAELVNPDWVLLTNVQVDQLNRFGEPENVYRMLHDLAARANTGVVLNAGDANLSVMGRSLVDQGVRVETVAIAPEATASAAHGLVSAPLFFEGEALDNLSPLATLTSMGTLPAPGLHYGVDAALALAMAQVVSEGTIATVDIERAFSHGEPVYGRGETISYRGRDFALTMMKNLPSLQVNLDALEGPLERVWVAVDEGTPDPSWIYDVDLGPIDHVDVISGSKALQWAMFLEYRGIAYGQIVEDTAEAMRVLTAMPHDTAQPVHAIVNYEVMMVIRRLAGYKELEGRR
jgi:lipid II isoglutaminyl synthase (glutamine-hydrolysing)